jgi:predicted MFS family arabinose efflux permease
MVKDRLIDGGFRPRSPNCTAHPMNMHPGQSPTSTLAMSAVGLVALATAMGIGRFAFTPLLPMMQADGLVTIAEGGDLAFAHFLGYLVGAILAVRLPLPGRMLSLSLLVIAVATLGMGLTQSMPLWLAFRWLAGLCSAFALTTVGTVVLRQLAEAGRPERQGWVFSGVGAGIMLAGFVALGLMVADIGSAAGWRVFGAISLLATAWVWWLMRGLPHPAPAPAATRSLPLPRAPLSWPPIIAYTATGLGYIIPATYLPVMAREIIQSPLVFGWAWPIFGATAALSTLLAGRLYRLGTYRQVWGACQLVMAAGLLLPAIAGHIAAIMLAGILVGGTFVIITLVGIKEMHRIAPPHDAQRHIAVITAFFAAGQTVGPLFAARIHEATASFSAPLLIASAALAVTAAPLLMRSTAREAWQA